MRDFLSGNEAVARAASDAGVHIATAYPGTPSTEILEEIGKNYKGIDASWSPNEKVAYEVAYGASVAGARALVCMKHVGVNVAADPLFTSVYSGVGGGFVIISADDPGMHSSQNEQDNRNYAAFAKLPLLEPVDSNEAYLFTKLAFDISEKFDTPVLVRLTTRISHTKTVVEVTEKKPIKLSFQFEKNPQKYVMVPGFARKRHIILEEKMPRMREYAEQFEYNESQIKSDVAFIASGIDYEYAKEALPDFSSLKLGMTNPFPVELVKNFVKDFKKVYVIESLDPYLENNIKILGLDGTEFIGKDIFPICGELSVNRIKESMGLQKEPESIIDIEIPNRPPALCKGCSHSSIFEALRDLNVKVTGDIGCYTLGTLKPFNALDTCLCMGASVSMASGFEKVKKLSGSKEPVVGVLGDSTFVHSGITGLVEAVYNKANATIIILDNSVTAMTGHQVNPASGYTLMGQETFLFDFEGMAKACGVKDIHKVNVFNKKDDYKTIIENCVKNDEVSVIIVESPCVLDKMKLGQRKAHLHKEKSEL